jgi:2-amino-4-hydroxy-6-hydroxymethyldihydropteridine diphosphokinase
VRVSPFFETEPVGHADQRLFLNAVVEIRTAISPDALLAEAKRLERRAGRTRTFRNGPRTLDVDLLDVRSEVRSTGNLTLPHPRMHRRRFVLEPLAAIAPHWRHPVLGKTANQMLRDLDRDSPSGRDEIAPTRARRGEERARPRRR